MTTTKHVTQDEVLSALRPLKTGATAADLAVRLHASERAVRRHLAALHEEKRVIRVFVYSGMPPVGRYRYALVREAS